jgi:hypothetical protein
LDDKNYFIRVWDEGGRDMDEGGGQLGKIEGKK